MLTLINYSLTTRGVRLGYRDAVTKRSLTLTPFPTCQLLVKMGYLKRFTCRDNDQPVIVEAGSKYYWQDYVKLMQLDTRLPYRIMHLKDLDSPRRVFSVGTCKV